MAIPTQVISVEDWRERLAAVGYLADDKTARMVQLAYALGRPLLLEGPAGVGKTSLAKALSAVLDRSLERLQCYEGIGAEQALYDWNYHKQLADLRRTGEENLFTDQYILPRPLMKALQAKAGAVLLIDEVDRADEAFEALVLEYLAEQQISVPEWQTVRAEHAPVTILTSNRNRPLSDALRRRCLYVYVDWPSLVRERDIVRLHVPKASEALVTHVVSAVRILRTLGLLKLPGIAETIDWTQALMSCADGEWSQTWIRETLGCVIKDPTDMQTALANLEALSAAEP